MTTVTTDTRKTPLEINIRVIVAILRIILLAKCTTTGLVCACAIELPEQNLTLLFSSGEG